MFVAIISSEERIHFIGYMILIYITMIVLIIILLCQVPFTWIASILLWDRSLFRCPMPYSIHWYVTFINQFVLLSRFHHRSIRWSKYRSWEDCHDASCAPIVCKFIIAECSWLRLHKAETSRWRNVRITLRKWLYHEWFEWKGSGRTQAKHRSTFFHIFPLFFSRCNNDRILSNPLLWFDRLNPISESDSCIQ